MPGALHQHPKDTTGNKLWSRDFISNIIDLNTLGRETLSDEKVHKISVSICDQKIRKMEISVPLKLSHVLFGLLESPKNCVVLMMNLKFLSKGTNADLAVEMTKYMNV